MLLLSKWFIVSFGLVVAASVCCGDKPPSRPLPKPSMKDYLMGEILELKCLHTSPYQKSDQIKWKFTSYGRTSSIIRYYAPADNYLRTSVENSAAATLLQISPAMVNDSGRFDCLKKTGLCSWKINVHDPEEMVYVMTSRGQKPWGNTVVSHYRVVLEWTPWTNCDGCAGNGERRKFGFCYVMWQNLKAHCSDTKDMPILMRAIAKRRREEIIVDVCFDHCVEYEQPIVVEEQRVDVSNGADVVLSCVEESGANSIIRWERNGEVLKRSDVSFRYAENQPIYIAKNNDLQLHKLNLPRGGVINIACVEDRQRRSNFDLYISARPDIDEVKFTDHLFWIVISSAVQIIAFLLILFFYLTIENMMVMFGNQSDDQFDEEDEE